MKNPNEINEETYEDLNMAEIVDFDKYEGMLYSELADCDATSEIIFEDDDWEDLEDDVDA